MMASVESRRRDRRETTRTGLRDVFLQAIKAIRPLVADPRLAERWDGPSALELMSVRALAGHLLRGATSVEAYLDRPAPDPTEVEPVSAAVYVSRVTADVDIAGPFHSAIRSRGEEAASDGPAAFLAEWDAASERLEARLAVEPDGRLVRVYMDMVLFLDDYLVTRCVELCLHADDLAVSVDRHAPPLPPAATELALRLLVDVARLRHGDPAVLRALARRERDAAAALRVL